MIVVDTSVLACLFLDKPETPKAQELLRKDSEWAAPAFWRIEFLNILSSHCKFAGLPSSQASRIWRQADQWRHLKEIPVDAVAALSLSVEYRLSAYDALFIALAQSLGTVCVTQDKGLRKALPSLALSIESFLEKETS